MRILITGSRSWEDRSVIHDAIWGVISAGTPYLMEPAPGTVVVHGDASGADRMADSVAKQFGLETEKHLPDWRPYGIYNPQAGKLRNSQMVALGADICLAFIKDNSGGATDCADKAEAAGIRTVRYVA